MPGIVRKLVIYAAVDGLVLQPLSQRQRRPDSSGLHIDYTTKALNRREVDAPTLESSSTDAIEAHGIIGLLDVSKYSFLIAITGRKHVAQIWDKPIYLITDVALIPLSSQSEALRAIRDARQALKHDDVSTADQSSVADLVDGSVEESRTSLEETWLDRQAAGNQHGRGQSRTLSSTPEHQATSAGVAQDVIARKGIYGRFAESWFSKRGWTSGQKRNMGMSSHDNLLGLRSPPRSRRSSSAAAAARPASDVSLANAQPAQSPITSPALKPSDPTKPRASTPTRAKETAKTIDTVLPKLTQTLKLLFMSSMFHFSYEYDITRRCAIQPDDDVGAFSHQTCDLQYFWNAHLTKPLAEQELDEYVLPIMQGFIGQRAFELEKTAQDKQQEMDQVRDASSGNVSSVERVVDDAEAQHRTSFLLTLISRRSTKRAGFRYMRRGIDDNGNVANCVETEQILSSPKWEDQPVRSFVQTRGSIPLFYSQTPYTFKPVPTLHGSKEANQRAFRAHFSRLASEYGQMQAVSLIDRHGGELTVGNAYEEQVELLNKAGGLNGQPLKFEWFDFHDACRGMKFENVSILIDTLKPFLSSGAWTTLEAETGKRTTSQSGVVRTNCMDCLDRTNVAQSAIAQYVLTQQLSDYLPNPSPRPDPTSEAFNSLWADNGDAISLTYAGTAALKGDYVRTRRRNIAGVLTDLSLTLSRYYRNLFDDFFAQAVLDFALGSVGEEVFIEFRERMVTADVGVDLGKARELAVATAGKVVVIDEHEDLLDGWVMSSPASETDPTALESATSLSTAGVNTATLRAQPFRELLLLLSDAAIYIVTYDWDAEKVRGFERVPLLSLKRLQQGAYITQTLSDGQKDPDKNVGLLVEFEAGQGQPTLRRTNTRTVGSADASDSGDSVSSSNGLSSRLWAFKALPAQRLSQSNVERNSEDSFEWDTINKVTSAIQKAFERCRDRTQGEPTSTISGNSAEAETRNQAVSTDDKASMSVAAKSVLGETLKPLKVEQKDIVSLQEAQRGTTIIEQVEYGLKRLVWG